MSDQSETGAPAPADIVQRLRAWPAARNGDALNGAYVGKLMERAAEEIDALRQQLSRVTATARSLALDHSDPGTEALAAIYCAERALSDAQHIASAVECPMHAASIDAAERRGIEQARKVADKRCELSGDCERLGSMDWETGARECSLDVRGGDCLCAIRCEEAEAIRDAIAALQPSTRLAIGPGAPTP